MHAQMEERERGRGVEWSKEEGMGEGREKCSLRMPNFARRQIVS